MLPDEFPGCSDYQFSFCMQPASEVGGDYYDYKYDGKLLTFGIGDATGHGMQASVIVTAIKLLFSEHSAKTEPVEFLRRASRSISLMGFRNLFLAFAIGKLDNHILELAGAGMPTALVYRSHSGAVEKLPLKGLPLGSKAIYPYQKVQTTIEPGDTVLLMTDGFPELTGKDGFMIGYDKTIELFTGIANLSPVEIIEKLNEYIETWLNGKPQNDDITFFAFKRVH
jgi:serine phosphatase RsbU (regulator of sigma subunit)